MKTLLIIESPNKRKKIESILGDGFVVAASYGHVRDLPVNDLGVSLDDFSPRYVVPEKAEPRIANLRSLANSADRVLLATDDDREGEAIAWHVATLLKLRTPERVTFREITDTAIREALSKPRPIDMDLVRAQEARRVLDRLVGYRASPVISRAHPEKLTAGRVQSPAVRLVVDRERLIESFRETKHFGVRLSFAGNPDWHAVWVPDLQEGEKYVLERELASQAADVDRVRVVAFETDQALEHPAAPFTTSSLQQIAHRALKFKPAKTMQLAQSLYESGHITYMRTDSPNLSIEAIGAIRDYAFSRQWPLPDHARRFKTKADAQEAHEAIRPTHIETEIAGDSDDERAVYRVIRLRAIASQLADAVYDRRLAHLESVGAVFGSAPARYIAKGRTLKEQGWRCVYEDPDEDDADEDADEVNSRVPNLRVRDVLDVKEARVQAKKTKPPPRFTQATLIAALESNGIGRPSTYAPILENITTRGYILEEKKSGRLKPSETGCAIRDALVGRFAFAELEYTRSLEEQLDLIAQGRAEYQSTVAKVNGDLDEELASVPKPETRPCPACGKPLVRRSGKRGVFWGCSDYPACTHTMEDDNGRPGVTGKGEGSSPKSAQDHACPDCGKPLARRAKSPAEDPKGKGFDFWGCTGFRNGCKSTFKTGPNGEPLIQRTSPA